jgi:hypothetical protein
MPPLASFEGFKSRTLMPFFTAFFCVAILLFSSCVDCLCGISHAEQQLTAAFDVPFRDQVVEADQFFLNALLPLSSCFFGQRIFFVLWRTHFAFSDQYPCQRFAKPFNIALAAFNYQGRLLNAKRLLR